jgi:hypothetical protein
MRPSHKKLGAKEAEPSMDFVFLAIGAAMFALFALYAVLLRGV